MIVRSAVNLFLGSWIDKRFVAVPVIILLWCSLFGVSGLQAQVTGSSPEAAPSPMVGLRTEDPNTPSEQPLPWQPPPSVGQPPVTATPAAAQPVSSGVAAPGPTPGPVPITTGGQQSGPGSPQPPIAGRGQLPASGPVPQGGRYPSAPFPGGNAPAMGRTISLNFDDADVYSVMKVIFGDVLAVNYVIDPRVKGRVTFRSLRPVPVDQVLPLMEIILRQNGIGVVEESGLYRIVPIGELAREPTDVSYGRDASKIVVAGKAIVQVVPIIHVSSSEVIKIITPFLSTNAVLIDVPKGNQIIIVDTDASVKRILRLVEIFDSEATVKRQGPEVFVYPVQNGKAKDVVAMLRQLFLSATPSASTAASGAASSAARTPGTQPPGAAQSSAAAPSPFGQPQISSATSGSKSILSEMTKIFADEIINSVVVLATPEDYKLIEKTIKMVDIMSRQVVIEGVIAEVDLDDNMSLGVAWQAQSKIGGLKGPIAQNGGDLQSVNPAAISSSGFTWVGTDVAGVVRGLVTALETTSKARLLATPHILVSDNREAHIQVGQQVPIPTSSTYGTPGVAPIQTIQYKDIGIILKVKPQVNDGGLVSLEISQEVSTFSTVSLSAGTSDIIINKTEAATSLVVPDGQTILIGGLIQTNTTKGTTGIPYLSRIPIIGLLFADTTGETKRTEIIILLTPRVIKNQKDAQDATSSYVEKYVNRNSGAFKKGELTKDITEDIENKTR